MTDPVFSGPGWDDNTTPTDDIHSRFKSLASQFGATISSMDRTAAHNAEVGGVPNSQHVRGTAADFVVPPDKQAAFMKAATDEGLQVIDERTKGGTGPHLHVQLPRGSSLGQVLSKPDTALDVPDSDLDVPESELDYRTATHKGNKQEPLFSGPAWEIDKAVSPVPSPVPAPVPTPQPSTLDTAWQATKDAGTGLFNLLGRIGADVREASQGMERGANTQQLSVDAEMVNAYETHGRFSIGGITLPVTKEAYERAKSNLSQHAQTEQNYIKQNQSVKDLFPVSKSESDLDAALKKDTFAQGIGDFITHPIGFASKAAETVGQFSVAALGGPLAPAVALGQVTAQTHGSNLESYLSAHGIDPSDKAAVLKFMSNPDNVAAIQKNDAVSTGAQAIALAASMGTSHVVGGVIAKAPLSLSAKTALNIPAQIVANSPFVAAQAASNASAGIPNTPGSLAEGTAMTVGFGTHAAIGAHAAMRESNKRDTNNLTNSGALNAADSIIAARNEQHKADMEADQGDGSLPKVMVGPNGRDMVYNNEHKIVESAEGDTTSRRATHTQSAQAQQDIAQHGSEPNALSDAEQKATEEEAGQRTIAGQRTANKLSQNPALRVTPAEPVTPETVQAEWQSQKDSEDARLHRVEMGQLTERIRTRDELASKDAETKKAAQDKANQQAQIDRVKGETKRQNGIIDKLRADNPDASPEELAPLLKTELDKPAPTTAPTANGRASLEARAQKALDNNNKANTKAQNAAVGKKISELVKANPDKTAAEIIDMLPDHMKPTATPEVTQAAVAAEAHDPSTPAPTQSDAAVAASDDPAVLRAAGMHIPVDMKGGKNAPDNRSLLEKMHSAFKALLNSSPYGTDGVQQLIHQGTMVVLDKPETIGRDNHGQGATYDPKTGKIYVYLDNAGKEGVVAHLIAAAQHEATHGGQHNGRGGRGEVMGGMMGTAKNNRYKEMIVAASKDKNASGHKLAKYAVDKALEAGQDAYEEAKRFGASDEEAHAHAEWLMDKEIMPSFAEGVAKDGMGAAGRLRAIGRDMVAGGKQSLRDKLGLNLKVSIHDVAHAARRATDEAAATKLRASYGKPLDMIGGLGANKGPADNHDFYKGARDGKHRFEFSDENSRINPKGVSPLNQGRAVAISDILHHDELFSQYPELAGMKVHPDPSLQEGHARYKDSDKSIHISTEDLRNPEELRRILLHEVQHAIQSKEGFVSGTNARHFVSRAIAARKDAAVQKVMQIKSRFELPRAEAGLTPAAYAKWEKIKSELPKSGNPIKDRYHKVDAFLSANLHRPENNKSVMAVREGRNYQEAFDNARHESNEYDKEYTKAHETYLRDYGETEARNTEHRRNFTDAQRKANKPESTMKDAEGDVPVEDTLDTRGMYKPASDAVSFNEPPKEDNKGPVFDHEKGIGATPNGMEINYRGYTTKMRPSEFLKLATERTTPVDKGLKDAIASGKAIAPPFLQVDFSKEGSPKVVQHEGRGRMLAIKELYGDSPVDVQIHPANGLRARDMTQERRDSVANNLRSERDTSSLKDRPLDMAGTRDFMKERQAQLEKEEDKEGADMRDEIDQHMHNHEFKLADKTSFPMVIRVENLYRKVSPIMDELGHYIKGDTNWIKHNTEDLFKRVLEGADDYSKAETHFQKSEALAYINRSVREAGQEMLDELNKFANNAKEWRAGLNMRSKYQREDAKRYDALVSKDSSVVDLKNRPLDMASRDEHDTPLSHVQKLKGAVRTLTEESPRHAIRETGRQIQVGWMAARDRAYSTAERAVSAAKKYFDKLTSSQRDDLNDLRETGKHIADPVARQFFESINPLLRPAIDIIRKHEPELLKNLNEFYLPHITKITDVERAKNVKTAFSTRGNLAGDKAYLKAKTYKTTRELKEAIASGDVKGIKLVTDNPAELAMIKLGELLKYAHLLEFRSQLIDRGYAVKHDMNKRTPDGMAFVRDPSFSGYAVAEPIANDLNNYLSRGLQDVPGFGKVRYLENLMVAGKLGWSGFHAGFTTMDNFVTHAEVALRRGLSGDITGGLIGIMKAPLSIVSDPYSGGVLHKVFLGDKPSTEAQATRWAALAGVDEHTMALLDALEKGGMRANMDASEWNGGLAKEIQAIRQKNLKNVAKNVIPAIADASGYVIHRKLVPAQKMAANTLMLKFELDRFASKLGKERGDYTGILDAMHPDAVSQIARKVVNLVDDRLGHMAYDNQFWNPFAKHIAQLTIMAPGWVMGTLRTATGGLYDAHRLLLPEKIRGSLDKEGKITDAHFGRLTSRTSNLMVLTTLTMAASGAFMYMLTGQWPKDAKDYVHPKTGRKNADGTDERISWPTYLKEHYALLTDPVHTLGSKINQPLGVEAWQLIKNADFSNTQIHDTKAPLSTQAGQIAKYIAEGFYKPITASNYTRNKATEKRNASNPTKNDALLAASFFGVTPAPARVDQSDAEQFINEKYFDTLGKGVRTLQQKEHQDARNEAVEEMRMGHQVDLSQFTPQQRTAMRTDVKTPTYVKRLKGITDIEDKIEAWDKATPEERTKYGMKKILLSNARTQLMQIRDPDRRTEVAKKLNEIREEQ